MKTALKDLPAACMVCAVLAACGKPAPPLAPEAPLVAETSSTPAPASSSAPAFDWASVGCDDRLRQSDQVLVVRDGTIALVPAKSVEAVRFGFSPNDGASGAFDWARFPAVSVIEIDGYKGFPRATEFLVDAPASTLVLRGELQLTAAPPRIATLIDCRNQIVAFGDQMPGLQIFYAAESISEGAVRAMTRHPSLRAASVRLSDGFDEAAFDDVASGPIRSLLVRSAQRARSPDSLSAILLRAGFTCQRLARASKGPKPRFDLSCSR